MRDEHILFWCQFFKGYPSNRLHVRINKIFLNLHLLYVFSSSIYYGGAITLI